MLEPDTIDVATPAVQLRVLSWGHEDAPIALCLHGFPDTAYGWRKVAPGEEGAGHFLQLDQPDVVGRHVAEFIGQAS